MTGTKTALFVAAVLALSLTAQGANAASFKSATGIIKEVGEASSLVQEIGRHKPCAWWQICPEGDFRKVHRPNKLRRLWPWDGSDSDRKTRCTKSSSGTLRCLQWCYKGHGVWRPC